MFVRVILSQQLTIGCRHCKEQAWEQVGIVTCDVTDVTNTRLPYTKCTRRYGELSRNFQKTPSSSHSSYHKRLGTRLHALLILLHTFLPQEHEQIPPQTFNRDAA